MSSVGRGVKLIYYMQKFFIRRDVGHRPPVMRKADIPLRIDHAIQRHAPKFKKVYFLPIGSGNGMIGVWQTDERNAFIFPVLLKDRQWIGTHSDDLCAAACKLTISIAQARQLRAAIRSHEAAQKG